MYYLSIIVANLVMFKQISTNCNCTQNISQYLNVADVCLMMGAVSYNRYTRSKGSAYETGHAHEYGKHLKHLLCNNCI